MFLLLRIWALGTVTLQCIENPIYVYPEMKLCALVPNYYIHVYVSDLYIPKIGLLIWLQQDRQIDPANTEHYNSVLEIRGCVVSFLGIHKSKPDIYIGFSRPIICSIFALMRQNLPLVYFSLFF
jgi:hypothetical protein